MRFWSLPFKGTQRKIESVKGVYLVLNLIIAIDP
jgi:hypothetical protein